jgi:hypothetical protein
MSRRTLLRNAVAGGAGFAIARRLGFDSWVVAGAPETVVFDRFLNGLGQVNNAPRWQFVNVEGASAGTLEISDDVVRTVHGKTLKIVTTTKAKADYVDLDVDFSPWNVRQGDAYAYERAQGVGYVTGAYRVLEFWIRPDPRFRAPATSGGEYSQMSFGTYTTALSRKNQNNQEAGGYHGYHSILLPRTNGNWMKVKMMRPQGFRTASPLPAAICTIATTNGIPFQAMEPITCTPSGVTLRYQNEAAFTGMTGSPTVLWGLWTAVDRVPKPGDTIRGATSGALRTISAATLYMPSAYEGGNTMDACGIWTGFSDRWVQYGGCNAEWYADYPNATYWDRVTRFYVMALSQPDATVPSTSYLDDFTFVRDDRDDQVAVSNLGAFYDPDGRMLYVTWQRNSGLRGKHWKVVVGSKDLHTNGLTSGTEWQSVDDSDPNYHVMSAYAPLAGTVPDTLYIAVHPHDRPTFAQIAVPLKLTPPSPPSNVRVIRG